MDLWRKWIVLALLAAIGSTGAFAGTERRGISRARTGVKRLPPTSLETVTTNTFHWVTPVAGDYLDEANDVVFDSEGYVVAAGSLSSPSGISQFAVARFSPQGMLLWTRVIPADHPLGSGAANAVAVDREGNIAAAGYVANDLTGEDFVVMKWRSNGDALWASPQIIDGGFEYDDAALSVTMDSPGNVIAAGYISAPGGEVGQRDFTVMKFAGTDGVRTLFYTRDGPAGAWDQAICVAVDRDATRFQSFIQEDIVAGGYLGVDFETQFHVVKLKGDASSPGEALLWERTIPNLSFSWGQANSIAVDSAHNVVAAGVLDDGAGAAFTVVKLASADGSTFWPNTPAMPRGLFAFAAAESTMQEAYSVAIDQKDDVVVGGVITSALLRSMFAVFKLQGTDGTQSFRYELAGTGQSGINAANEVAILPGNFIVAAGEIQNTDSGGDFTAIKLDPTGNPIWQRTLNGSQSGSDAASSVAVDPVGNIAVAGYTSEVQTNQDFTVAYVDTSPPRLLSPKAFPNMFPPSGGASTITTEVEENIGVKSVKAVLTYPDRSTVEVPLARQAPTAPSFPIDYWSADYTFPANTGTTPALYDIFLVTDDVNGNIGSAGAGKVQVEGDGVSPLINNCTLTPTSFTPDGGELTIAADVTDNVQVDRVVAHVQYPGGVTTRDVVLTLESGNRYSGTHPISANTTSEPQFYSVDIDALDPAGNKTNVHCGTVVVEAGDTQAPALFDCQVNPRNLPSSGGQIQFTAKATDNVAVTRVAAMVTRPNGVIVEVLLAKDPVTQDYNGLYFPPANGGNAPEVYRVKFEASDAAANTASAPCGTFSVASSDADPPTISNCSLDQQVLPPSGGAVTITTDAVDASGVTSVIARISRPDGGVSSVALAPVDADTYTGTYNAPANPGGTDRTYTVFIVARDKATNTAVLNCGTFRVLAPDITGPTFVEHSVSPELRPSTGGPFDIAAEVTDNRGVDAVVAIVRGTGGFSAVIPLNLVGNIYRGTLNAPPYSPAPPENGRNVYEVELEARDTSNNVTAVQSDTVGVIPPDSQAPTITSCDVTPRALLAPGGPVRFRCIASDSGVLVRVEVKITNPDLTSTVVTLDRQVEGDFAGSIVAPANMGPDPLTYGVEVSAVDLSGNTARLDCGTYTVAPPDNTAPVIVDCKTDRQRFLAAGGATRISAIVTDNAGVASVQAVITRPDSTTTTVSLKSEGGDLFAGDYVVPANTGSTEQTYGVEIRALDTSQRASSASCGDLIVAVLDDEPPVISNASVTPGALDGSGGAILVQAEVNDNASVASVVAEIRLVDSPGVTLLTLTAAGGSRYSGALTIPSNPGTSSREYRVLIRAEDTSGSQATAMVGPVTVSGADRIAPLLENCALSTSLLSFSGGVVKVSVDATDNVGVTGVVARLLRGGTLVSSTDLTAGTAPGYSADVNAPANGGATPQEYTVELVANDAAGNVRTISCGTFTVAVDTVSPTIVACNRTPSEMGPEGGTLRITATVTDSIPLDAVFGVVTRPDGSIQRIRLQPTTGDEFGGQLELPANRDPTALEYQVDVEVRDIAGNTSLASCGTVIVALADGGRAELSSANIQFGRVRFGTRFRREVIIRNRSRTSRLAGSLSTLGTPFSVRIAGEGEGTPAAAAPGDGGEAGFSIAPGEILIVSVDFAPRDIARYRDRLLITTSDPRRRRLQVRVSGVGCRNGRRGAEIRD